MRRIIRYGADIGVPQRKIDTPIALCVCNRTGRTQVGPYRLRVFHPAPLEMIEIGAPIGDRLHCARSVDRAASASTSRQRAAVSPPTMSLASGSAYSSNISALIRSSIRDVAGSATEALAKANNSR